MTTDNLSPDDEFDKAFSELAKPAGNAVASGGEAKAQAPAEPKPEATPPADKPAADAADKAAQDKDKPAAPAAEPTLADLQRQIADLQQRERSSAGRVSHFMRESDQQSKRVKELEAELAQRKKPAPPDDKKDGGADDADDKDMLAEAPELRAAVERRISKATAQLQAKLDAASAQLAEVGKKVDTAARNVEPLVNRDEQRQVQAVYEALNERFTGWREEVKSPGFADWLQTQPAAIKGLFSDGKTFEEAGTVLTLYRARAGAPKSGEATPGADNGKGKGDANKERLREAAGLAPRSAAPAQAKADDFESAFAEFASQTKR